MKFALQIAWRGTSRLGIISRMDDIAAYAHRLFGITLSPRQCALLRTYEQELLAWNRKHNLTAINRPEEIRSKHFLDSLSCVLAFRDAPPRRLADVGTGAGFPGIPLKILYPEMHLTLIESVGKKVAFCKHIVHTLEIPEVHIIKGRAEEVGQQSAHREHYDWVVARAVAMMPTLSEYLLPLTRIGGHMLAMKGETAPVEAQNAQRAWRLLGGRLRELIPVTLPGVAEERYLVVVDKIAATPPQYPRRAGVPRKRPL